MRLTFLKAADDAALCKAYGRDSDGQLTVSSYPQVANFSSFEEDVETLEEFLGALQQHAAQGHCLLKGLLDRPLDNESRAGHTSPTQPTRFIVLDIDTAVGFQSIDDMIKQCLPALDGVSYIWQHSSSAGIKGEIGIRGHLIAKLDAPVPPDILKQWLYHTNLTSPALKAQLSLNATGLALKYPLDVSTCQNDKLIYIADPECGEGVENPFPDGGRFELRERGRPEATLNVRVNAEVNRQLTEDTIIDMRASAGLPKRKAKTTVVGRQTVLTNPDAMTITGVKIERGYVYFNLNYGDSWGYFTPCDNPEIVNNFKGEPAFRLRDAAPEIYAELTAKVTDRPRPKLQPLALRDMETDTYYNLLVDPENRAIEAMHTVSSKDKIHDFYMQYGKEAPELVQDWTLVFDPTTLEVYDPKNRWVNTFQPTEYMTRPKVDLAGIPKTISRLIHHVCGSDDETYHYFLNWIAWVWQNRQKSMTAWAFSGTYGTGKGVLFNHVLKPLFGEAHSEETSLERAEDQFNSYLERNIILFFDEANIEDTNSMTKVMNKIKSWITEPTVMIRAMRRNPVSRQLYNNMIFASNDLAPVHIERGDRRFNIAPPQMQKIDIVTEDLEQIQSELGAFADYLAVYAVDEKKVRKPLENEARDALIDMSINSVDEFFNSLKEGNFDHLAQYIRHDINTMGQGSDGYGPFQQVLITIAEAIDSGENNVRLSREEIFSLYAYIQGAAKDLQKPGKFGRLCAKRGLPLQPLRKDGKIIRGLQVDFTGSKELVETWLNVARAQTSNVTAIRKVSNGQ